MQRKKTLTIKTKCTDKTSPGIRHIAIATGYHKHKPLFLYYIFTTNEKYNINITLFKYACHTLKITKNKNHHDHKI